jgi:EmrB/QacA subfamily drug resistance transporter
MIILDASIVNVALPSIQRGLNFPIEDLSWVLNIYVLFFGGFLLLGGRAGDIWGRRELFMGGMVLFSLASLLGGFAQSPGWLIAARGAQGLGGAIMSPIAFAIVTSSFPEGAQRNRAVGIYGSLSGLGGAIGVLLGGILTSGLGWRWVLFVNVPVGIAVLVLAPIFIPKTKGSGTAGGFDIFGAVSITASLSLLVYGVIKAPDNGWASGSTIGFFAGAIVLFIAFMVNELRAPAPLVRLGIFRIQSLAVSNTLGFLTGLVLFGMFYFLSLYLQLVLGFSALKTGFAYLPLALTIIVAAGLASGLVTRFGFKRILAAGMILATIGLALFSRIRVDGTYPVDVLPAILLAAAGLGFIFVPLSIAAVMGVKPQEIGLASGLINTSQQIGGAIGLAVLSTIYTTRYNAKVAQHFQGFIDKAAAVSGFHYAFAVSAVVVALGVVLTFVLLPARSAGESSPSLAGSAAVAEA